MSDQAPTTLAGRPTGAAGSDAAGAELVAAWEHTARSLVELGRDCDDDDFATATDCPGWDVQDQLSHVTGVESSLLGRGEPEHDLPDLAHVRGDFGRRVEVAVDIRRPLPGAEVVAELAEVVDARSRWLREEAPDPGVPVLGPLGRMPHGDVLRMRTFDVWCHEQDVRRGLGRPGGMASPAAAVAVARMRGQLPRVLARGAALGVGTVVVLRVSGPVAFTEAVRIEAGDDGRARGVVLDVVPDAPDVRVDLGTEAYARRSAGRWDVARTAAEVTGDADLGARVLAALAFTP